MNNYNNYPDSILKYCLTFAQVFREDEEKAYEGVSHNIINQSIYDVISPLVFTQFIKDGETDILSFPGGDEEALKVLSYCDAQIHLRQLEFKKLVETFDDGASFHLSEFGRNVQEEILKIDDDKHGEN